MTDLDLSRDRIDAVINAVFRYVQLHETHLGRPPNNADVLHSALLRRLLSGKPPLPKPPPTCFSYPCYPLGEGEPYTFMEIWEGQGKVCIDQGLEWEWIDPAHVDDERRLRHIPTGEVYRFVGPKTIQKES